MSEFLRLAIGHIRRLNPRQRRASAAYWRDPTQAKVSVTLADNECIIGLDRVCRRMDQRHLDGMASQDPGDRFWVCRAAGEVSA